MKLWCRPLALVALVFASFIVSMPAAATTYTWDASGNNGSPAFDGPGTWDIFSANWWTQAGGDVPWGNTGSDTAVFGASSGAAGVVTVGGLVSVNSLIFNAAGSGTYFLSGGTVNLSGPSIAVNATSGTIGSVITGASGLTKTGAGLLYLTGSGAYSGTTTVSSGGLFVNGFDPAAVTLSSGTLGGTGVVGPITVASTAAPTIEAGSGGLGSLTINGNVIIEKPSSFAVFNVANYIGSPAIQINGNLTAAASMPINIYGPAPSSGSGSIPLLNYTGSLAGTTNIKLGNHLSNLASRSSFVLSQSGQSFVLQYSVDYPVWTGAGNGDWSTASQTPYNWKLAVAGTGTNFMLNDAVVFNDSAGTGTTKVTISDANVAPASVTFNNNVLNYTVQGPYGIVNGTGVTTLTLNGSGAVTISTSNGYSGGTTINTGLLNIANSAALGSAAGAFTINGGSLDSITGGPLTLPNYPTNWNGSFTFVGSKPLNLGAGSVTLGGSAAVTLNNGTPLTIGGPISDSGTGFTQNGAGLLVLTGSSSYTGPTNVNGGTLSVGNGGSGASIGNTSGVTLANNTTLLFNHANAISFAPPINGAGNLVKSGSGTLTLTGASTYSGNTAISGGVLRVSGVIPANVPSNGLIYNLDASNSNNYILSGGYVTQWNDLSGNGNNFTNANSTVAVVNGGSAFNGNNVLSFNSSATSTLALNTSTNPQTVFIIEKVTASLSGDDGMFSDTGVDQGIRVGSGPIIFNPGNANDFTNGGGSLYINGVLQSGNATAGGAQLLEAYPGANTAGPLPWYSTSLSNSFDNRYFDGQIGQVVVYSSSLSTSERQSVESYLMNKWLGITYIPGGNGVLPSTTALTISNGGTFDMTNGMQTIAFLSSTDGNGSQVLLGNGQLTISSNSVSTFDGVISGNGGSLILQGGMQTFTNANSYTGGTTISSGTLQLGDRVSKNGSVAGNITNNSALVIANPTAQTYGGVIGGNGSLTKVGSGVLTLTMIQGYSGSTVINGGTIKLSSGAAASTLAGFGGNGSGWAVNGAAISGNTLTLTDGNSGEARSAFYGTPINVNAPFATTFTYLPTTGINSQNGYLADGMAFVLQTAGTSAVGSSGGGLGYQGISPSAAVVFNLFSYANTVGTNFTTGGAVPTFNATGNVNFDDQDPIKVTLAYDGSNTLTESLQDLTLGYTYSTTYNAGNLASTLGNNAYVGFTAGTGASDSVQTISNFTSSFTGGSNGGILPSTTALQITSGTLDLNGSVQTVGDLSGSGMVTNTSASTTSTLTTGGDGTMQTYSGVIADNAGQVALVMAGPGGLTLTGSNRYSGGTTVAGGTLQLGNRSALGTGALAANGGMLDLSGFSVMVTSFSGASGAVTNSGSNLVTLTVSQSGTTSFGGSISDGSGPVGLKMTGSGSLYLTGGNAYSGPTTINAGLLLAAAPAALSPGSAVNITGGTLDVTAAAQTIASLAVGKSGALNLSISNPLSSNGTVAFASGSTLNILGTIIALPEVLINFSGIANGTFTNVTYDGSALPSGDALSYANNAVQIVNAGSFSASWNAGSGNWSNGANWNTGSAPNGAGQSAQLNQAASGPVAITLDVPVTLGTLELGNPAGPGANYTLNGATLTFNNAGATATVTVQSGMHTVATPVVIQSGNLDIAIFNGSSLAVSGDISDDGGQRSLTLDGDGSGLLILSGSNTYGGGTIVHAGTLIAASAAALRDGTSLTVGEGASSLFAPAVAGPSLAASPAGVVAVPEPGTLMLLVAALGSAMACLRFSKRSPFRHSGN